MNKKCEIKEYINKLPISEKHKEYINDKHNMLFDELENSRKFRLSNGVLYAFKHKYNDSLAEITKLNKKFGSKVAAIVDTTKAKRVVRINAISISKDFVDDTISMREGNQYIKQGEVYPTYEDAKDEDVDYTTEDFSTDEDIKTKKFVDTTIDSKAINYSLKASDIVLKNIDKIKSWEKNKSITPNDFWNKIQQLGIPKEQLELLRNSDGNSIEEKVLDFVSKYSYTVEINTAKNISVDDSEIIVYNNKEYTKLPFGISDNSTGQLVSQNQEKEIIKNGVLKDKKKIENPTQHYSDLTVPGGTNYTENEISTPLITPSIKGHAQFATDKGIGWFRSDEQRIGGMSFEEVDAVTSQVVKTTHTGAPTKTRRILEVQSDLFQKGRDKKDLTLLNFNKGDSFISDKGEKIEIYDVDSGMYFIRNTITNKEQTISKSELKDILEKRNILNTNKENQFLQLLNKDNNWVTFFVKSIIQDSAKKGYEKVLFPTGNTASKVEGHTTLEEFKKEKEDRIKELEKQPFTVVDELNNLRGTFKTLKEAEAKKKELDSTVGYDIYINSSENEINQLKKELERVDKEGFAALKPIYKFYEETVTNILKKQGFEPKLITDEYGNTWNEVAIDDKSLAPINLLIDKNKPEERSAPLSKQLLAEQIDNYINLFKKNGVTVTVKFDETKTGGQIQRLGPNNFEITLGSLNGIRKEALAHEFSHIYIDALGHSHPLIQMGIRNAKKEFPNIWEYVQEKYTKLYKGDQKELEKELLVNIIGKTADEELNGRFGSMTLRQYIENFFTKIAEFFGIKKNVAKELWKDIENETSRFKENVKVGNKFKSTQDKKMMIEEDRIDVQFSNLRNLEEGKKTISLRPVSKHPYKKGDVLKVFSNNKDTGNRIKVESVTTIEDFTKIPDNKKDDFARAIGNYKDYEDFLNSDDYTREDSELSMKYPDVYEFTKGKISQDVIKYSLIETITPAEPVKKEQKQVSPKEQLAYRRIVRLTKELAQTTSEIKKENIQKEIDYNKSILERIKDKTKEEEAWLEYGTHTLDLVEKKIESLRGGLSETLSDDLEYINEILNIWKDDGVLASRAVTLRNSIEDLMDSLLVKNVKEYHPQGKDISLEKIKSQNEDISTRKAYTGSLLDLPNYIASTIGAMIRFAQNKVESRTNKIKREIDDKIKEISKTRDIQDIYDEIIATNDGKTFLKHEDNLGNVSKEALDFYKFYQSKLDELIAISPVMTKRKENGEIEIISLTRYFIPNVSEKTLKDKLNEFKVVKERKIGDTRRNEDQKADIIRIDFIESIDAEKKSKDLGNSLFLFANSLYNYDEMSNILPKVRLMQRFIEKQEYIQGSNPNITKGQKESNLYKIVDGYIKAQVKGEFKEEQGRPGISTKIDANGDTIETYIDITGTIDRLLRWNSVLRIGLSPISAIANVGFGKLSNFMEAIGGKFFNRKELRQAEKIFWAQNNDENSVLNKELLSNFNILQELTDYEIEGAVKKGKQITGEKLIELMYSPQKWGEKYIQSSTLLAMMIKDGYMTPEGVLTGKWTNASEQEKEAFTLKVTGVNGMLHGRYSPKEAAILQQNVIYRMISQFRKWLPAAIEQRFDKAYFNPRLNTEMEGRYITFNRTFILQLAKGNIKDAFYNLVMPMINAKEALESGKLTETEIYNMRKMLIESVLAVGTMILYGIGTGAGDDDKKRRKEAWFKSSMLLLNRISGDLTFFYSPEQINNLGKNAIPMSKLIDDLIHLAVYSNGTYGGEIVNAFTDDNTVKSGIWKGTPKVLRNVINLVPGSRIGTDIYKAINENPLTEQ